MALHPWIRATACAVVAALALSGCSAGNAGGSTTCKDYKAMSKDQRREAIKKYFAEKGTKEPSNAQITLAQTSALLYCNTAGSDSDPIKNIDG